MITPEMYNELRIQEQQGQEMADEKNKSIQLRKDIMKLALAESATDCTIMCGTLFAKFNVSIHEQMAKNLKTTLQTFFDNRKKMIVMFKCQVHYLIMNTLMTFMPIVDFRTEGVGI